MFTNITWAQYLIFVVVSLMAYYIYVGIRFYSIELSSLISGERKFGGYFAAAATNFKNNKNEVFQSQVTQLELFDSPKIPTPGTREVDDKLHQAEKLKAQLKLIIDEAASKHYVREEFILSLQLSLKKYQYLKDSPFMVEINNLITSECEKYGYIKLNAEERVMLWNE